MNLFINCIFQIKRKLAQIILLTAILLTSTVLHAQNDNAVVALPKMNAIYVGLENPVSVAIPNTSVEDIIVKLSGKGTITGSNGKYFINPVEIRGRNRVIKLEVYKRGVNNDTVFVSSSTFRVMKVPSPEGYFGPKYNGQTITRTELRLANFVSARLENFVFEGIKYRIQSYSIAFKDIDGESVVFEAIGSRIPINAKIIINGLEDGDQIIISNIVAKAKGLGEIKLKPIILTIKD